MQASQKYNFKSLTTAFYAREGDVIPPETQALIDAAVAREVAGLKTKNSELLGSMKTKNDALTAAQELVKQFEGIDPVKARAVFAGMEGDEDAKLLIEGKLEQIKDKHTARMKEAHAGELKVLQDKIKAAEQVGDAYRGRVLDAHILAVSTGVHKTAVADALLAGRQTFTLDAKGNAVKLDAEGNPELGKDGKTPFGPGEWMEAQREAKPHWFPASASGSGASGNTGAQNGKTMKRSQFDSLAANNQRDFIKSGGTLYD